MKAIPFCDQPVLFTKLAKTNFASWCVGAFAGTVTNIMKKEIRDVNMEIWAIMGSHFA